MGVQFGQLFLQLPGVVAVMQEGALDGSIAGVFALRRAPGQDLVALDQEAVVENIINPVLVGQKLGVVAFPVPLRPTRA